MVEEKGTALPREGMWDTQHPSSPGLCGTGHQHWPVVRIRLLLLFFFFLIIHFLKFYLVILGCAGSLWQLRLFSRCGERGGHSLLQCASFSLWWLLLLQSMGSRTSRLIGCSSQALEHRQSSCGPGSADPRHGIFLDQRWNSCLLHWQVLYSSVTREVQDWAS